MIELREYQKEAVSKLSTGSILLGGVGSGKSITSIAYFYTRVCGGNLSKNNPVLPTHPKNLYILTTAKKRDDGEWDTELLNFSLSQNKDCSICGIRCFVDSWHNIKKYVDVKNAFFIFDEQKVSGYGVWSHAFLTICKFNDWILLSATPGDTWHDYLSIFIANGFFKNKTDFERRHCVFRPYVRYKDVDHYVREDILNYYKNKITVVMNSPESRVRSVSLITIPYDRNQYRYILKNRWNIFSNTPIMNAPELCHILRRSVDNSEYRLNELIKIFNNNKRIIVFYNFNYELESLKSLSDLGYPVYEYNGHVHEEIPDSEEWIYCVQYISGSEGWNCVKSNTIVFYSLNYSYKTMEQASGRIDRMNSPYNSLNYYVFRTMSGIDLGIVCALRNKRSFNEKKYVDNEIRRKKTDY